MNIVNFEDTEKILETLKSGGIVIYPTETCYGVGVDATNPDAVTKVLEYKKRPEGKAISVACFSQEMAEKYVEINETAKKIYKEFLPGPVTVISKSRGVVDKRLESENGNLGIRIPAYPALLDIIQKFGKPITSTSANSAGKKNPYSVNDILENISEKQKNMIDLIIDVGELPNNPPSTVIDTTAEDLTIYRKGSVLVGSNKNEVGSWKSESVEETVEIGKEIIEKVLSNIDITKSPAIILLDGQMGAGKTHLTKGLGKALGVTNIIKSPTYNYVDEHNIKIKNQRLKIKNDLTSNIEHLPTNNDQRSATLYHIDAWRIRSKEDLALLQFDRYLKPGNVVVIEWPSVVGILDTDIFKNLEYFTVELQVSSENSRQVKLMQ